MDIKKEKKTLETVQFHENICMIYCHFMRIVEEKILRKYCIPVEYIV